MSLIVCGGAFWWINREKIRTVSYTFWEIRNDLAFFTVWIQTPDPMRNGHILDSVAIVCRRTTGAPAYGAVTSGDFFENPNENLELNRSFRFRFLEQIQKKLV